MLSNFKLLTNNHEEFIKSCIKNSKMNIEIISPFICLKDLDFIKNSESDITIITKFNPNDFISGASSIECLLKLLENKNIKIYAMKNLHSKLYLFDSKVAIIGSANFTDSGLNKNVELSVSISDDCIVKDINKYFKDIYEVAKNYPITKDNLLEFKMQNAKKLENQKSDNCENEYGGIIQYPIISKYEVINHTYSGKIDNTIKYIQFEDREIVKTPKLKNLIIQFMYELYSVYPDKVINCIDNNDRICTTPINLRLPAFIAENLFVETNFCSERAEKFIKKTMQKINFPLSNFKFYAENDIKINNIPENNEAHPEIKIDEKYLEYIDKNLKENIEKLDKYKITDSEFFAEDITTSKTFKDNIVQSYGINTLKLTNEKFMNTVKHSLNPKALREKGRQIRNIALLLLINESYPAINNFKEIVSDKLKYAQKIIFDCDESVNLDLIKDVMEKLPDCVFKINVSKKCITRNIVV